MNYSEMTNAELDRLSAEIVLNRYSAEGTYIDEDGVIYTTSSDAVSSLKKWEPTDTENTQAEQRLFPWFDVGINVFTQHLGAKEWNVFIQKEAISTDESFIDAVDLADVSTKDKNKINTIKVIACLEAWDKLKEVLGE